MFWPIDTEDSGGVGTVAISGHRWWNGSLFSAVGMPAPTRK